ncbi:DUF3592 domain-containing protein [uncultured Chitinophaga sp.]|uniref:DUF3592 domain-containing protein n=1 Tax=uncultured Chitinophaga sp. TaxID=339340 RepID=UPI0025CBC7A5|nr:DUF3592 domain-containing protein [uncultured Chitinophaga sp.]
MDTESDLIFGAVALLVIIIVIVWFHHRRQRLHTKGVITTGEVINIEQRVTRRYDTVYHPVVCFFMEDGRVVVTWSWFSSTKDAAAFSVGDQVEVTYNPKIPDEFIAKKIPHR